MSKFGKKIIKAAKEVVSKEQYSTTQVLVDSFDRKEKEHPIWYKISGLWYRLIRKLGDIKYFFKSIWFFLFHGFTPYDWYCFPSQNAKRMVKILTYYREHNHIDFTSTPKDRKFSKDLDTIIEGFGIISKGDYEHPIPKKMKKRLCKTYPESFNMEELKNLETNYYKAQKALDLFAEHYLIILD